LPHYRRVLDPGGHRRRVVLHLHQLDPSQVRAALEDGVRCRQLGEPSLAESICRDVLEAVPESQSALCLLVRAICDQLLLDLGARSRAQQLLPRIKSAYQRELLTGVVLERHARALLRSRPKGSRSASREGLMEAIRHYEAAEEAAEKVASERSIEALLRRNGCIRSLTIHDYLQEASDDPFEHFLE